MAFLKTFSPHQIVGELFQIPLAEHPEWAEMSPMKGLVIVQEEELPRDSVQTAVPRKKVTVDISFCVKLEEGFRRFADKGFPFRFVVRVVKGLFQCRG